MKAGKMRPLADAAEAMMALLGLDGAALEQRSAFMAFGDDDAARLRRLHALLADTDAAFFEHFYSHLLRFEPTRRLLPDQATLERLKRSQTRYFQTLTAGEYGLDYARERLRVGIAHRRIGLESPWYLGAYAQYLSGLLPQVAQHLEDEPEQQLATLQSLLKVVLLDISLAVDAYLQTDRQAMAVLKQYSELVFAALPNGLVVLTADGRVLSANRAFLRRFGFDQADLHGQPLLEWVHADGLADRLAQVRQSQHPIRDLVLTMAAAGGSAPLPVRVTITGIRLAEEEEEEEEEEARLLLIVEDITEQARLQQALRDSEADLLRAQRVARIGSWRLDCTDGSLHWTPEVYRMFGIAPGTALDYPTFLRCVHPDDHEMLDATWQAALHGATYRVCHRIVVNGSIRWVEENAEFERATDGTVLRAIGTVQDITERKADAEQIEYLAFYDPLTGLANRALFTDRLKQELAAAERNHRQLALLYLDLDRFKEINDSLGHNAGDRVLVETARRLRTALRQEETLARLGGDEFVVIASYTQQGADRIAERITAALNEPVQVDGSAFMLSASIGVAVYPDDGRTPEQLLQHADIAMYRAKAEGSGLRFYRPEMGADLTRRLEIARRLEQALKSNGLHLCYQPQVQLSCSSLIGAEALVRWNDPQWGPVAPSLFIPVAEERGLIDTLGEWVLGQACRQTRLWHADGRPLAGRIAVNVAARQFDDDRFVERMIAIAHDAGLSPAAVELELTESGMMRDPQRAIEVTRALTAAGFALAIDDFGTGYSSLAYLKRFDAHKLKIDMSFVRDMLTDPSDHAIVKTIIAMGHSLGLETLAEGVEQAAQAQALAALGCNQAQGYHFGRPLTADAFAQTWLRG